MRRFENDRRRDSGLEGLVPAGSAQAPAVAGDESREPGARGAEVVPLLAREREEVVRHPGAHDVDADVVAAGLAAPVPVEAGEGFEAAGFQIAAEHVFGHAPMQAGRGR